MTRRAVPSALTGLAARCLACVVAYALASLALFSLCNSYVRGKLVNAFPTADDVLSNQGALESDDYQALASISPERCGIVVFDGSGRRLYASNAGIAQKVGWSDLPIINEYDGSGATYEVLSSQVDGKTRYVVVQSTNEDGVRSVRAHCTLDENLKVVEGNLFQGRTSLTRRELALISGSYEPGTSIEKYEYENDDGEKRTIVITTPVVSDLEYDKVVRETGRVWLLAIPVAVALTAAAAVVMVRVVRASLRPMDRVIEDFGRDGRLDPMPSTLVRELRPTYEAFSNLMRSLEDARGESLRMIADLSHDVKTPLTVIRGYAQALCDGKVPEDGREAALRAICDRSVAATGLINELLDLARMEHPDYEPHLERCDLRRVVDAAVSSQAPLARQRGCTIATDVQEGELAVETDARLLQRALANVIGNACGHNPSGTHVLVTCRQDGGEALVCVCDDGVGIPEGIRDHVFEPFVTGSEGRSAGEGTGLGLYAARRCCQLAGATLSLLDHPQPPHSTIFEVRIPLLP